jgi:hypothetical protein
MNTTCEAEPVVGFSLVKIHTMLVVSASLAFKALDWMLFKSASLGLSRSPPLSWLFIILFLPVTDGRAHLTMSEMREALDGNLP